MKNIIILFAGLLLISATAVTTTQIVQPKQPIDVKCFYIRFGVDNGVDEIETKLNIWRKSGYILKNATANNYGTFLILEKY